MISSQISSFHWSIRIYYEDTDAGGIVYNANYLKYFERARTEWLRQCELSQQAMYAEHDAMFVLKSAFVDYHLPARLDDELVVSAGLQKIGRASLVFVQHIWRNDQCLVQGRFKVGCVDTKMVRPRPIPAAMLQAIHVINS